MKPSYNHIQNKSGAHVSGICKLEIAPVKWLQRKITTSYITGSVGGEIRLLFPFIKLGFTQNSCKHIEKIKSSKAGDYFDITVQGLNNAVDHSALRTLQTLRFESLLVLLTNSDGTKRLIGDHKGGMRLIYSTENNSMSNEISIDLSFTSVKPSPFYINDSQIIVPRGILTEDGDELVTEDGATLIIE